MNYQYLEEDYPKCLSSTITEIFIISIMREYNN